MVEGVDREGQPRLARSIWSPGVNPYQGPSIARARLCWLGESDHVACTAGDRTLAEQIMVCAPHLPYGVRTHRAFLRRAVRYLVRAGVRQFLDLGSGVPAAGNVHEIALEADSACRVAYVDLDPVVVADGCELVAGLRNVSYLQADFRRPADVLAAPEVTGLLDLSQPTAVLLVDILHFVPDSDDPARLIADYADALGAGSHVVISHMGRDDGILAAMQMFSPMWEKAPPELTFRGRGQLEDICQGLTVVDPGIVPVPLWHPDGADTGEDVNPERFPDVAVVATKP
jgi:SAM-dependent methyltransferase